MKIIYTLIVYFFTTTDSFMDSDVNTIEKSQLEVRAVIVKCQIEYPKMSLEEETIRFQREELFKHNAIRNCKQKLAITVKTTSVPNQSFGDEYIPIEHVLGYNKKKNRLLNPYVLRLRRKLPFQSYKLRKIETVSGIIWKSFDKKRTAFNESVKRENLHHLLKRRTHVKDWSTKIYTVSDFTIDYSKADPKLFKFASKKEPDDLDNYDSTYICKGNSEIKNNNRRKRHSKYFDDDFSQNQLKHFIQDELNQIEGNGKDYYENRLQNYNENYPELKNKHVSSNNDFELTNRKNFNKNINKVETIARNIGGVNNNKNNLYVMDIDQSTYPSYNVNFDWSKNSDELKTEKYFKTQIFENSFIAHGNITNEEHELALYEIGDPDLWYTAQVQLYEKITSPEGKVLWNDLTKHAVASVSTQSPNWSNQDVNIQYKSIQLLTRDDFALPSESLCLVVPLKSGNSNFNKAKLGDFIIVPTEDIITLNDQKDINKRNVNTFGSDEVSAIEDNRKVHRKVAVRTTRALVGGKFNNFKIITRGSDRFLKLPHRKPHQTQIDVEVRADDNEIVFVGIQGRLTTIVSDSTRSTRSVFSIQAANMGLAGARLRVVIRECTPKLLHASTEMKDGEGTFSRPVLFPPRQTQNFRLNLPLTIPVDNAHCTVALINENEDAVAVRDVKIKRDDRCFCVWHCDCVCLSEDPNLLCRPLSEAQLNAAGLSIQEKSRHIRSVCYEDVMTINLFVMFVGVLLALLFLGMIKASLGIILRCVGMWGINLLIQTPRKLDQYYENSLKCRNVVYDNEGWPIHPDTKQRSVRLISKPMEFILNLIFFITLPCLLICDALKKMVSYCTAPEQKLDGTYRKRDTKKCFSTHEVQSLTPHSRHRHEDLLRWMSPRAEELSKGIWQEGLIPQGKNTCDCLQPLLRKEKYCEKSIDQHSCLDSEHDETAYILMQMQKKKPEVTEGTVEE